ncbi:MAG TPA: S8 family serine peptidase, partial [Verrucomicrobiae bacterium]|nr:S8 family serine peptidase [Verrucomicrobiae bacterium]
MKFLYVASLLAISVCLRASNLDSIGVTVLRQVDSTLQGSGVPVAQVEAPTSTNIPPPFEVNPGSVGQPTNLFTYISSYGIATGFTNNVGAHSGHADGVANNFYGSSAGVAPQITHVTNYEADFFYNNVIKPLIPNPPAIAAQVVNQSFIFDQITTNTQANFEQNYDNYAAQYGTLFVSGVGNGGSTPVSAPASCYNGIGVADDDGGSSAGPTYDGRCKPDITAPGGATSFSTPYVAGSAAVLVQAGARGDGGTNVADATDLRTVKALLLNGAIKPVNWTNGPSSPLDARYGAGVLNVFNSWEQLRGGEHSFIEAHSFANGSPHPPGANTNNEPVRSGWDFNTIANSGNIINYQDQVNHYYFNLPSSTGGSFTFTT